MKIVAHEPSCLEGVIVQVEVDIRRGIPGVDLVGLAAGAVRESRERVRAAVRNSGYEFPQDRVLINLAPADMPKEGAAYDLPIALAVLGAAGALPDPGVPILALGELRLDGSVRPVRGVLPAVAAAFGAGIGSFVVPAGNGSEARSLRKGVVYPIARLEEAARLLGRMREGLSPEPLVSASSSEEDSGRSSRSRTIASDEAGDLSELRGQYPVRRALEIAAAGGHNILLCGPPGSGKTMAARRFPGLLPDLREEEAVEVAALYSLSGFLSCDGSLDRRPPFRAPHHSASLEGMIGGGRPPRPGEISLAHHGVLFLDEASEFRTDVLQSLREPLEEGRVSIVRANSVARFPADFQLILAANPCPCGNLGRKDKICLCSVQEILRHRRKMGGPLLDRIDIRVAVEPTPAAALMGPAGESSADVRARVESAIHAQAERYRGLRLSRNARLRPGHVETFCRLDGAASHVFERAVEKLSLSSRACHSILKTARTIADLDGAASIGEEHVLEAIQHRRLGDGDAAWPD